MERVFLDANVLFSAAYREDAGLARFWKLKGIELVTSSYAVAEARVNMEDAGQLRRLDKLVAAMTVVEEQADAAPLPAGVKLPEKDKPILRAAIVAKATHLITGDWRHFGAYFGKSIQGVTILPPADYPNKTAR